MSKPLSEQNDNFDFTRMKSKGGLTAWAIWFPAGLGTVAAGGTFGVVLIFTKVGASGPRG